MDRELGPRHLACGDELPNPKFLQYFNCVVGIGGIQTSNPSSCTTSWQNEQEWLVLTESLSVIHVSRLNLRNCLRPIRFRLERNFEDKSFKTVVKPGRGLRLGRERLFH